MTAGTLFKHYKESIQGLLASDDLLNFMNMLKETPAYWKLFSIECSCYDETAVSTYFFLTLSCADLQWNEIVEIILRLNKNDISTREEIKKFNLAEQKSEAIT